MNLRCETYWKPEDPPPYLVQFTILVPGGVLPITRYIWLRRISIQQERLDFYPSHPNMTSGRQGGHEKGGDERGSTIKCWLPIFSNATAKNVAKKPWLTFLCISLTQRVMLPLARECMKYDLFDLRWKVENKKNIKSQCINCSTGWLVIQFIKCQDVCMKTHTDTVI